MSNKAGSQSLSDLFDGSFYRIPDYQRGYAWGMEQLEDFWEDLLNSTEHKHYTGVLSLEKVSDTDKQKWITDKVPQESKAYYIVDGQQRLTTSVILLKVILDTIGENVEWFADEKPQDLLKKYISKETPSGKCYFFGYTNDNPSYEFLKTRIFGDQSSSNSDEKSIYTKNLEDAKAFFSEKINKENAELIFKNLTQNFIFNVYEIDDEFDVYVAFETINNRGKPLSSLELLKNRLIYLATKFDKDTSQRVRECVNNCWKEIYKYLGKNIEKILKDDDFLKVHWLMYFDKYERNIANPHKEFLLKEHFILKNVLDKTINAKDIEKYALNLKESAKHYYFLHNLDFEDYKRENKINKETFKWLEKIQRLNFGAFEPLLVAILYKRENGQESDDKGFVELLKDIEKFLFLMFSVSYRQANFKMGEIYKNTFNYFKGAVNINKISEFIREIYIDSMDLGELVKKIERNFREQSEGYYGWKGLRYFLFEYEEFLREKYKNNAAKINWAEFTAYKKDSDSIEHILPQTPNKEWESMLLRTAEIKNKRGKNRENNIYKLTHSLGNLVPLAISINSELKNKGYSEKIERFKRGSYAEIEISQNKKWDKKAIESRCEELLKFMFERWGINEILEFWEQNDEKEWAKEQKEIQKELVFRIM